MIADDKPTNFRVSSCLQAYLRLRQTPAHPGTSGPAQSARPPPSLFQVRRPSRRLEPPMLSSEASATATPGSVPVDTGATLSLPPKLLPALPGRRNMRSSSSNTNNHRPTNVPVPFYHNNVDNKEHLAIVFGDHIRSRKLRCAAPWRDGARQALIPRRIRRSIASSAV